MPRALIAVSVLLSAASLRAGAQAPDTAAPPAAPVLTPAQTELFSAATAEFGKDNFTDSLPKFKTLHAAVPGNPLFAKFGAEAAVNVGDYATATSFLQPILVVDPDDVQALAIQAHSYAQQGDSTHRDAVLAHLQTLHDAGATKLQSIVIEKDPLPNGGRAVLYYYLEPFSRFHIALMARLYDAGGKQTSRIALESDDIDQISFAKDHPTEAAAGVRIYSMDGYSEQPGANGKGATQTHSTLCPVKGCFMMGRPSYDLFRTTVLNATKSQPLSTTTGIPMTTKP